MINAENFIKGVETNGVVLSERDVETINNVLFDYKERNHFIEKQVELLLKYYSTLLGEKDLCISDSQKRSMLLTAFMSIEKGQKMLLGHVEKITEDIKNTVYPTNAV